MRHIPKLTLAIGIAGSFTVFSPLLKAGADEPEVGWKVAGHDAENSRSQAAEKKISVSNAASLAPRWVFAAGAVSATPTVADNAVYFPDWAGNLFAVNKSTGKVIWSHQISDYDHFPGSFSRVSPAISGDLLVIGDNVQGATPHFGANIIAVDRQTGDLRWITTVDSHLAAIITGSPSIVGNKVYAGVSSIEEGLAVDPSYPCCSFRGSVVALDLQTGRIKWKTYTVPDNAGQPTGYSGGAVWQPVAVDSRRGTVFAGTGNNYEVPQGVKDCLASNSGPASARCFPPDDYFDTALAIDLESGRIKWAYRVQDQDVWTVACLLHPTIISCPEPQDPDHDFSGSGPNLLPNMVGFGNKSGVYWAFNPDSGDLLWYTIVGPNAAGGSIEWGTATDGKRIYVASSNSDNRAYALLDGSTITWGAWNALDPATGKILWQTGDPAHAIDPGAVSVANGVLYTSSFSGEMHALNAANGKILWTFPTGNAVMDGPSIVDGTVYWGSGYQTSSLANSVYAFTIKGKPVSSDEKE
jgi:polyvinyl alcohol dehydrogenase (cytochrome)